MDRSAGGDAPTHATLALAWLRSNPPRVLLAEDDEEARALLPAILRRDGLEVIEAHDGFELAELIERGLLRPDRPLAPDVIVTDSAMPGLSGLDVVRRLRADDPDTPVIVITGLASDALRREALRLGVGGDA